MKSICIIFLLGFFSNLIFAQTPSDDLTNENSLAVSTNLNTTSEGQTKTDQPKVNWESYQNTVSELSQQVVKYIKLPDLISNYNSEMRAVAKVQINSKGEITHVEMEKSIGKTIDEAVIKALYKVAKVTPVLVGGTAQAQAIHLPVVIKP